MMRTWPDRYSSSSFILVASPESIGSGVLAPGCLKEAAKLRRAILDVLPTSLCGRADGTCEHSLLYELENSHRSLDHGVAFLAAKAKGNKGMLPYSLNNTIGGFCCGSEVKEASALRVTFDNLLKEHEDAAIFEQRFLDICRSWRASPASCPGMEPAYCLTSGSYESEQKRSIRMDSTLIGIAVGLMVSYVCVVLGRSWECVQSKIFLGISVIISVLFSFAVSHGIGAVFGIPCTQLSLLAVFILLGVGIDDAFIINDAFERTSKGKAVEERLADALEEVGPSVCLTSATDMIAFSVGISYTIEAVRYFCITAAIAVFVVFLLQVTWFAALLVLNYRRQADRRLDILPCFQAARLQVEVVGAVGDAKSPEPTPCSCGDMYGWRDKAFRVAFHPVVLLFIVLVFVVLLASSVCLIFTDLRKGFKESDYIPADSYVAAYWKTEWKHFGRRKAVGVFSTKVDLRNEEEVTALNDTIEQLSIMDGAIHPREDTWVDAFHIWRRAMKDALESNSKSFFGAIGSWWYRSTEKGRTLARFLDTPMGPRLKNELVPQASGKTDEIVARAWIWMFVPDESGEAELQAMKKLRAKYAEAMHGRGSGFVWADFFLNADRYERIDHMILESMAMALAALAVVCFVLLPPIAAAASVASIVLVNIDIIGFISLWGVQMQASTAAFLVLALGFSVDYSAHIAEAFCVRQQAQEKGVDASIPMTMVLHTTGKSVLHAGVSTFLAVLVLAFSSTKAFQDVFKIFFLMVVFGILHGMILLPALLVTFTRCAQRRKKPCCAVSDGQQVQPELS